MPHNSNFRRPCSHRFFPKMEVTAMAPNHGGDPLGSIFGPMGSHLVKKMGINVENYHAPKFEFSTMGTRGRRFFPKNGSYGYGAKSPMGTLGSILGPMGSHWVQKRVKALKNYNAAKFEFSTTPRSSIFPQKWKLRLWRQITVGNP